MSDDAEPHSVWSRVGYALVLIVFALLIEWALTAFPFLDPVVWVTCLGVMMVGVPLFIFTRSVALNSDMKSTQKIQWTAVVGYLIGFFVLISSILFSIVRGPFAILGVCAFSASGIIALAYYVAKASAKENWRMHAKALAWELKDQMRQLKEQLSRGDITQEECEQKMKLLEDQLEQLRAEARMRHL